jgi:hypothetical protein
MNDARPTRVLMTHNPGFLDDEEIRAGFVVRGAELEALLEVLREPFAPTNQHLLVIGRRGMGKTMLVNRLVVEVQHTPELAARWIPVVFGEESYNVATAGELWLEALFHVAEQTGEPRWRSTWEELLDEPSDDRLREAALARLLDFADERGARLLLVVENLQDILGLQMSDDEGWILRHTLLNEPRIMLLATATNRFDDIEKPKKAAYELFRILELERLTTQECRELWRALTGEELAGRAIRPIEIFTGGNLRLVTVLAQFAEGRSFRSFMRELLGLLDDHSDYFKSNIEALPLDERRVFTTLCDLWEPSRARDVARRARFDVNKTSMLLGRLERRGAIETVRKEGRAKIYEVSERLYNLFHLIRRRGSRDGRVVGLIEFMVRYYSGDRLQESALWIAQEACKLEAGERRDNLVALGALIERLGGEAFGRELATQLPPEFWALPEVEQQPALQTMRLGFVRTLAEALAEGLAGVLVDHDPAPENIADTLLMLYAALQAPEPEAERTVRQTLSKYRYRAIVYQIVCELLCRREVPMIALAEELDWKARTEAPDAHVAFPYQILLELAAAGPDAALGAVSRVAHSRLLPLGGPSLRGHPILQLAAVRPRETYELLTQFPEVEPIAVALAMDLDLPRNAPREVVEVAKDVLEDIRARRESPRYTVPEPELPAAADEPDAPP